MGWPKPRIGISSCLLGMKVRHDGEHKKNDWLCQQLDHFVTWVPICPEVEMRLGVPRETMRLVGKAKEPRLLTVKSKLDLTERARETFDRILNENLDLDAYIFKKDSPTCGLERVKVYGDSGIPAKNGVGLFASRVKKEYSKIPMIEEGRLSDLRQREAFLIQLYTWCEFSRLPRKISVLQNYHQNHKLQLMTYHPSGYQVLGRLAANSDSQKVAEVFDAYESALFELLQKPLTPRKYINSFQHVLGYFKKELEPREKAHLLRLLEDYRQEKVPLASLTSVFSFIIDKYSNSYLQPQSIFKPYPADILTGRSI